MRATIKAAAWMWFLGWQAAIAQLPALSGQPRVPVIHTVPEPDGRYQDGKSQPLGGCLTVAAGVHVVALGAYEGGTTTSFYTPGSPQAVGAIIVGAASRGPALVLVLTAHDPVLWDLRPVPRGRLRAVLVYGYAPQAIAGLPSGVPVRYSAGQRADPGCGPRVAAYEGGGGLDRLDRQVHEAIGRPIDAFYGGYAPTSLHVDGGLLPTPNPRSLTLGALTASEGFAVSDVPPKAAGIAELIRQGAIRRATPQDKIDLDAALTRASPTGRLAPVHQALHDGSYVILRPITIPRGMYGGNSAAFIIAGGVSDPVDPGSHNIYFRLADGRCTGSILCPHE